MDRQFKIRAGKFAAILCIPVALWAYTSGPDPRKTGAPGDRTCIDSGCHTGTAIQNSSAIALTLPANATTYTPGGAKIRMSLTVTDTAGRVFGFQASSRLNSNLANGQAGAFDSPDLNKIQVLCDNGDFKNNGQPCPTNATVQFVEHANAVTRSGSATFDFDWTPPATNVGNITIYVAANASRGGQNNSSISLKSYVLTPQASGPPPPAITAGGIVSAAAFGGGANVAPGSWIEIYGSNLSSTTRSWDTPDFNGSNAPTSLSGVKVSVAGKDAFVAYISPGQVNAQVPDGVGVGPVPVIVTNGNGASTSVNVTGAARAPGLHIHPAWNVGGKQYLVAFNTDGSYAGKAGLVAGLNFKAPKPGDVITIYGVGFGAVNPILAPGIVNGTARTVTNPTFLFGSTPAAIQYAGMSGSLVGVYQYNVTIPNVAAGDYAISASIDGVQFAQNGSVYLTVQP